MRLQLLHDPAQGMIAGQYVRWALEIYLNAKQGARQFAPYNPFTSAPYAAGDALMRLFGGAPVRPEQSPPSSPAASEEVAQLRRELDELKRTLRKRRRS